MTRTQGGGRGGRGAKEHCPEWIGGDARSSSGASCDRVSRRVQSPCKWLSPSKPPGGELRTSHGDELQDDLPGSSGSHGHRRDRGASEER